MSRLKFRDFAAGLWLDGGADDPPDNALRRATGVHPRLRSTVRSRLPNVQQVSTLAHAPHSLGQFGDYIAYAYDNKLELFHRVSHGLLASVHGFNGQRMKIATLPVGDSATDYLFLAGGGTLQKLSAAGVLSDWGIAPPTGSFLASSTSQNIRDINRCETLTASGVAGTCTAVASDGASGVTLVSGTATPSLFVEGADAIRVTLATNATNENNTVTFSPAGALNLTTFPTFPVLSSPDEDWITAYLRFDKPRWIESVQLVLAGDSAFNNSFTHEVVIDDSVAKKRKRGRKKHGLADVPAVSNNEIEFMSNVSSQPFKLRAAELLGEDALHAEDNVWVRLKVPKTAFVSNGPAPSWASINTIKLTLRTNARAKATSYVYIDQIALVGGYGTHGTYSYKITDSNAVTGTRSNALEISTPVTDLERHTVTLDFSGVVQNDTQATQRDVWRTLGNGAQYFKLGSFANPLVSLGDDYADYSGLATGATHVLDSTVLPDDNLKPSVTFQDFEGLHYGRVFWCRDSASPGRVYYSPQGRVEAVAGFLDAVADDDDTTQRLVRWNGGLYCFSEKRVAEIVGTDEPFQVRPVGRVPGTSWPFTVVATAQGIYYRATDGLRLFDGQSSVLISQPLGRALVGEAAGWLTNGFAPDVAEVGPEGEVWFADTTRGVTLAYLPGVPRWRDVGTSLTALYYARDDGTMWGANGGTGTGVVATLETVGGSYAFDAAPLGFIVEWPSRLVDAADEGVVQFIFVDVLTNNQGLTLTLVVDGVDVAAGAVSSTVRQTIEVPVGRKCRSLGIRLSATALTAPVEVYGVEAEVHVGSSRTDANATLASLLQGVRQ